MITDYIGGEGSAETPKNDYVIYGWPLSSTGCATYACLAQLSWPHFLHDIDHRTKVERTFRRYNNLSFCFSPPPIRHLSMSWTRPSAAPLSCSCTDRLQCQVNCSRRRVHPRPSLPWLAYSVENRHIFICRLCLPSFHENILQKKPKGTFTFNKWRR